MMASLCIPILALGSVRTDTSDSEEQMAFWLYLSTVLYYPVDELICWLELRSLGQGFCCSCVPMKENRCSNEHKTPDSPDHVCFLLFLLR